LFADGRLELANAGHPRPLLAECRADFDRFLAGGRRGDDLTLFALRRAG
jgi:hypothetical protein